MRLGGIRIQLDRPFAGLDGLGGVFWSGFGIAIKM
jgi:hypothetical protein